MRIGILGIHGRVGRLLIGEVRAFGADLVGGVARSRHGDELGVPLFADLRTLASQVEVVIDFTRPEATASHAATLGETGTAWVLGTTGLAATAQDAVTWASNRIAIVQAANFSPGVAVVLDLARRLAASLPASDYDVGIFEMHHRGKRDAPSGTALAIDAAVRAGRPSAEMGALGHASLRGGQIVGEHTLLFTAASEQISLTHRAFDRRVFATGAVRAALWTAGRPPGLYGMQDVLRPD
ncbi:4-hydroxy-tetrahydrodipicolinate reductase [Lichenicoccus sp.]|uniref:4-hydroxy-tetrahydrodipicolinate reductase n=1 Tax=Lichenicoccus sp. TaxID=2781899 RepID=UPI003D0CBB09